MNCEIPKKKLMMTQYLKLSQTSKTYLSNIIIMWVDRHSGSYLDFKLLRAFRSLEIFYHLSVPAILYLPRNTNK